MLITHDGITVQAGDEYADDLKGALAVLAQSEPTPGFPSFDITLRVTPCADDDYVLCSCMHCSALQRVLWAFYDQAADWHGDDDDS